LGERTLAESYARLLKKYGDSAAIDRGSIAYGEAKAEYDGVIAGLSVALARKQKPSSLPDLQEGLQRGFEKRDAFCKSVEALLPPAAGQKGLIAEVVKGALGPLIDAIKDIYLRSKDDDVLTRKTIQTQLQGTSWTDFATIEQLPLRLNMSTTPAHTADFSPGLYRDPVLIIDPGMHVAAIWGADVDAEARWAVTGSDDKTVRVWSLENGALLRTIRLPAGPDRVGKVYSVAISPDGSLIAVGGWTRRTDADPQQQIYLYDRASGNMVRRMEGLPSYANRLMFSPDGRRLVAVLDSFRGLRIYGRDQDWAEIGSDTNYGGPCYGVTIASDGRLAATSLDGNVRVYASDCKGAVGPMAGILVPGGRRPYGIAFSPDGARLAVGYAEAPALDLLDAHTLDLLPGPDLAGVGLGDLSTVAWSRDGGTLFASGTCRSEGSRPIFAWSDAGAGSRRALLAGRDTVNSIVPLPGNDLLVAAADPWLARLQPDGGTRWIHPSPKAEFRDQLQQLSVARDGLRIGFGFLQSGAEPAHFDLEARTLTLDPAADSELALARQDSLPVANWYNTNHPTLNGELLQLDRNELSRSLAIHPSGDRFVLGSEWWLRAFDAAGTPLWSCPVPADIWAVNITSDGRLVVAACGDGAIHWHRMDNGAELLAFMPLPDQSNWVAWTPEGFYAATPGARGILRWHVNRGWDEPADSVAIEDIKGSFRPTMLPLVLREHETPRALGMVAIEEHSFQITIRTNSRLSKEAQLHLLTIGISAYNEERAKHLRLQFAERDATELARTLIDTQSSLYAEVWPQVLTDDKASKESINRALDTIRTGMKQGRGDLAVVHFSGHGALVNGRLNLLPYDVDARDPVSIWSTGLWVEELRGALLTLAQLDRVLVLLDACHSGAITADGKALSMNSTELRLGLAAANVMVLTSSSGAEVSLERPEWKHGAFTKALIGSLSAADTDHDGLIGPTELAEYVDTQVRWLTDGAQTPGLEVRFNNTLFAARL
jgi:WD40 repeat protein